MDIKSFTDGVKDGGPSKGQALGIIHSEKW